MGFTTFATVPDRNKIDQREYHVNCSDVADLQREVRSSFPTERRDWEASRSWLPAAPWASWRQNQFIASKLSPNFIRTSAVT